MSVLLEARGLTMAFGGVEALRDVDLSLRGGEILGLCGENGAGKSTLIKILGGVWPHGRHRGEIAIDGQTVRLGSVRDAEAAGISVIHQELALVEEMSVAENLFLGHPPTRRGLIDWASLERRAQQELDRFGQAIDARAPVSSLGVGAQQLVEIARALARDSRVLILDEPTAALTDRETRVLFDALRALRGRGVACLYVSHRLDELFELTDRIAVLRDGRHVATVASAETAPETLVHHMIGRALTELFPRRRHEPGEVLLSVSGLSAADPHQPARTLRDIGFELCAGEVLGIGGLLGSGRSELLLHLFGAWGERRGGRVALRGEPFEAESPRGAIASGMVLVPESRKRDGLVLPQTIGFNLSLSSLSRHTFAGVLRPAALAEAEQRVFESLGVRAAGCHVPVAEVSGGNQQKVVLGKALLTEPTVVLLDEPTRGIDVGAKAEVCEIINQLTDRGVGVLLVSSELEELLAMSDRILILRRGGIAGHFRRGEATPGALLAASLGEAA